MVVVVVVVVVAAAVVIIIAILLLLLLYPDEATRESKKIHNEELSDLYSSPNTLRVIKSRRMIWAGHVARMGERRGVYRVLVGKPEGKRPLGRPRRRWEDNIKMYLREVGCEGMDWIVAEDRHSWRAFLNVVMNLRLP